MVILGPAKICFDDSLPFCPFSLLTGFLTGGGSDSDSKTTGQPSQLAPVVPPSQSSSTFVSASSPTPSSSNQYNPSNSSTTPSNLSLSGQAPALQRSLSSPGETGSAGVQPREGLSGGGADGMTRSVSAAQKTPDNNANPKGEEAPGFFGRFFGGPKKKVFR